MICPACGYPANSPFATKCRVCDCPLMGFGGLIGRGLGCLGTIVILVLILWIVSWFKGC